MEIVAVLIFGIIGTIFVLAYIGYLQEKEIWNNGVCKQTGENWNYYTTTFDGDRVYKDNSDNICIISHRRIDLPN